jgi:hypothetical protein
MPSAAVGNADGVWSDVQLPETTDTEVPLEHYKQKNL